MNLQTQHRLNDRTALPALGFGTNVLKGAPGIQSIKTALDIGYRLIDTAQSYGNEEEVGQAVAESRIPRKEIFVTTKISDENQGYQNTIDSVKVSLEKLQLDTLDIVLVHWPNIEHFQRSIDTFKALIALREQGIINTIGVSNYTPALLQKTFDATQVVPAINQVEFHPFLYQKELLDYCESHGIKIESYSPIARANKTDKPILKHLSEKYQKSPIQIILRWHLEHGLVPIPRSMEPEHIKANADIFDFALSQEEVLEIDRLNENYRIVHPENAPEGW